MNKKNIIIIGLIFFVFSHWLFAKGADFAYAQKPIDFAHWLNLIGAILLIYFNYIFPKNKLNSIASFLTTLGVIAHVGLCTIDFIFWSFGDDYASRNELMEHLGNTPSIAIPFVYVGPSLLFLGLATHTLNFIRSNPIGSILTIAGAILTGLGHFLWNNGIYVAIASTIFAIGLVIILYRKEMETDQNRI